MSPADSSLGDARNDNVGPGGKVALVSYGALCYLIGWWSFIYFAGWISNLFFDTTIDSTPSALSAGAVTIDVMLLLIYCSLHSALARASIKRLTRRYVPRTVERSTYCLLFSLLLFGLCFAWRPIPGVVWQVESRYGVATVYFLFASAWVVHFVGLVLINHNEFFGLRQIGFAVRGEAYRSPPSPSRRVYVRSHVPVVAGLILIPWATPTMSVGHLVFAILATAYCVVGVYLSDRDADSLPDASEP